METTWVLIRELEDWKLYLDFNGLFIVITPTGDAVTFSLIGKAYAYMIKGFGRGGG